jgi:hypothetical protein
MDFSEITLYRVQCLSNATILRTSSEVEMGVERTSSGVEMKLSFLIPN